MDWLAFCAVTVVVLGVLVLLELRDVLDLNRLRRR